MKFWTLILSIVLSIATAASVSFASNAEKTGTEKTKSCIGQKKYGENSDYILETESDEIKIMSYNVENLFDTLHDEGKDDYEFLPINNPEKENCDFKKGYYKEACKKTNWTEDRLELKLSQIKKAVSAQGEMPDMLAVLEVENVNIVSQLADYLGYPKFLVTSGEDRRIELAVLYKEDKVKLKEMKEIKITFPANVGVKNTRNILVANFTNLNNKDDVIGLYVNHWPSQASPSAARVTAAKHIRKAIDQFTKKYGADTYHVVAVGDFNTIEKDTPKPFDQILDKEWENRLVDVEETYRKSAHKNDPKKMLKKMAPSSYYYSRDNTWNHLDHIFVSANLLDNKGTEVLPEYFRIIAPDFLLKTVVPGANKDETGERAKPKACEFSAPKRYFHNATTPEAAGFSDHLPLVVKVRL